MLSTGLFKTGKVSKQRMFENEILKPAYELMSEMSLLTDVMHNLLQLLRNMVVEIHEWDREEKAETLKKAVWDARSQQLITSRETRIMEGLHDCVLPLNGAEEYITNDKYSVSSLVYAIDNVCSEVVKRVEEFDGVNPGDVPPPVFEYRREVGYILDAIQVRRRGTIQIAIETCIMRSAELNDFDSLREGIMMAFTHIPNFAVTFKLKEYLRRAVEGVLAAAADTLDVAAFHKAIDAHNEYQLELDAEIKRVDGIIRAQEAKGKMSSALNTQNPKEIESELQDFYDLGVDENNMISTAVESIRAQNRANFYSAVNECNVDAILESVDESVRQEVLQFSRFTKPASTRAVLRDTLAKYDSLGNGPQSPQPASPARQ